MDELTSQRSFARRGVFALIAAGAIARLVLAAGTGLGIDETYMVAVGRRWALGYFDHPPLAWWLAHGAAILGGESDFVVRIPFIVLFGLTTWLMYALTARLYGDSAGFIAAAALNAAPVLGVTTGTWVLPDGPLDAALLGGAFCLTRALVLRENPERNWLLAGACAGLALLSKWHGAFLLAGAGVFILANANQRVWVARPWPWLGLALAVIVSSPGLVWNFQHDWASFAFQGARAAARTFRPWMPFVALAGQAAFLAPWIWAPLMVSVWRAIRAPAIDPGAWLFICLGAGPILLFTLAPAWSDQRPYFHWAAPGYLLLFPLLGRWLAAAFSDGSARVRRWLAASLAFNLVATAGLVVASTFTGALAALLPGQAPKPDPLAELADWTDVAAYIAALPARPDGRQEFIIARRWYEAAKIDHALRGSREVICLGEDCRGYDYLPRDRITVGDDGLALIPEGAAGALPLIEKSFERVDTMPPLMVTRGALVVARLLVYRAIRWKGVSR